MSAQFRVSWTGCVRSRGIAPCLAFAAAALLTGPIIAQPTVSQAAFGAAPLHVVDVGGRLLIQEGERKLALELPGYAQVERLSRTRDGWVAAGRYGGPSGGELLVLRERNGSVELLPAPPGKTASLRGAASLLISDGALAGMAWLEGDEREAFDVRAARWNGETWDEPELVSPGGEEAQLALQGTVLDDGSWLLVWAAVVDGDDEIVWSRRGDGNGDGDGDGDGDGASTSAGWTAPERLHEDNAKPDVTPSLLAVRDTAVAAWSSFDGRDYRLRLSRFDGEAWKEIPIAAGRGVTNATLLQRRAASEKYGFGDPGFSLLFRSVVPQGWTLLDFNRDGRVIRRAAVDHVRTDRPLLEEDATAGGALFVWPEPAFHWLAESRGAAWEAEHHAGQ